MDGLAPGWTGGAPPVTLWAPGTGGVLLALGLALLIWGLPRPAGAAHVPAAAVEIGTSEPDVAAFLPAFRRAWASGDVTQVLRLFAPEAVVQLNHREPGGPLEYRGGGAGPMALREGVALLLDAAAQPDPAALQAAPVVFGGAPATAVRWAYRRPSLVSGVPPEAGADELVLQGGQLVAYTRTPDGPNEAARLGRWILAPGLSLLAVVVLAALKRPHTVR